MDCKLSEFITKTNAGPGFARDLLEAHNWDQGAALKAYYDIKGVGQDENVPLRHCSSTDSSTSYPPHRNSCQEPVTGNTSAKCLSEPSLSSPLSLRKSSPESSASSSPSKLAISKIDLSDSDLVEVYPTKLSRGISCATDNVNLVSKVRDEFAQDFRFSSRGSRLISEEMFETPEYTFTLPDLTIHPPDFSEFLEKDLIEKSSLVSLEGARRLNWWAELGVCQRLWPLLTSGDGNCLLHAASLGMWGFHDRLLTLRKALHTVMANSRYREAFYRRWRWQSSQQNREAGLVLCEDEWQKEWETLLRMASTEPRIRASTDNPKGALSGGKKESPPDELPPHIYESLEEIHILALAHVLKRPIIVIADTMLKDLAGEPFAPIPFGGIYLPLECEPDECHISPLCLTYDAAHFSALVAMEMETYADRTPNPPAAIPVADNDRKLLPAHFSVDPGETINWELDAVNDEYVKKVSLTELMKLNLLKKYLDIVFIDVKNKELVPESEILRKPVKPAILEKSMTLPSHFEFQCEETISDCSPGSTTSTDGTNSTSDTLSKSSKFKMISRRFGSLGRSFRQIKRNISNIAKRTPSFRRRKGSISDSSDSKVFAHSKNSNEDEAAQIYNMDDSIVAAALHTEKRHNYHEDMLRNYLYTARLRFLKFTEEKKNNSSSASSTSSKNSSSTSSTNTDHYATQCVETGCKNYGTATTNFLCLSCHTKHKEEATLNEKICPVEVKQNENIDSTVCTKQEESNETRDMKKLESKTFDDIPSRICSDMNSALA
ncbi:OTU domain-containing protein 7B [Halotydeus destructor]|nr:OTU domain-containing protein 7B [Halotydeus destructor]